MAGSDEPQLLPVAQTEEVQVAAVNEGMYAQGLFEDCPHLSWCLLFLRER